MFYKQESTNPRPMRNLLFLLLFCTLGTALSQSKTYNSEDIEISPLVEGTLLIPDSENKPPLVIIVGGSGPIDRNGNQMMMKNNSLKLLAEGLYDNKIASFRYDKRLIKIMKMGQIQEEKIDFDHFVEDALAILDHFKGDDRFNKIYVLGHSQGSLVGMMAAKERADGFISIAGAGQPIDDVIVYQLEKQAPGLKENARQSFDDLRVNGVAQNYSPGLASIFRPSIQPFIFSWMRYDPAVELAKLDMPVLIVAGDQDLQVQLAEADLLKAAKPEAEVKIIRKMNHIFKEIEGDDIENSKSYNEYNRPVIPELILVVTNFILQN